MSDRHSVGVINEKASHHFPLVPNVSKGSPSSYPYEDIVKFSVVYSVDLLSKNNYKVCVSFGCTAKIISLVTSVHNTGVGPNIMDSRYMPPIWKDKILTVDEDAQGLTAAGQQAV